MQQLRSELHDKDKKTTRISIDPGLRNFGLSFEDKKIHVCIDFGTVENLLKNMHKLFCNHFDLFNIAHDVVIESQRSSCQNERIEWYVRGLFGSHHVPTYVTNNFSSIFLLCVCVLS